MSDPKKPRINLDLMPESMREEHCRVLYKCVRDFFSNTAIELNPYTGLIGTPEQTDDGISCKCLINPRIKLNTRIYINSTLVQQKQVEEGSLEYNAVSSDGIYRVYKMSMSGDTRGTDWYMTLEAITQSGEKPVGLTGDSTKLWR